MDGNTFNYSNTFNYCSVFGIQRFEFTKKTFLYCLYMVKIGTLLRVRFKGNSSLLRVRCREVALYRSLCVSLNPDCFIL